MISSTNALPQNGVNKILEVFNDMDQHIKFTIEHEGDKSVPFLDTPVMGDNNIIKLD